MEQWSHDEKSFWCDRNNSNKKYKLWVFHTAVYRHQLLNSTVEPHHKLHVLIA